MTRATTILRNNLSRILSLMVFTALLTLSAAGNADDEAAQKTILLEGIASSVSFSLNDETSAILLLNSDVELIARILLVAQFKEQWMEQSVDNVVKFKARRLGVIIRILAHVATQVGEKVEPTNRDRWIAQFTETAGGPGAIQRLLGQSGTTIEDLKFWFSNMQLCRIQIQYMRDQIQMPSRLELKKMFQEGDHPLAGASFAEVETTYENIVRNKKLQRIISDWLNRFEQQGTIRFHE